MEIPLATEFGIGDWRCPECKNSIDNGKPADNSEELRRCASCKLIFKIPKKD